MGTDAQQGIILNIVVGIIGGLIGGLIGGFLLGLVGLSGSGGMIASFLTALVGACLLIWIVGLVTGSRKRV